VNELCFEGEDFAGQGALFSPCFYLVVREPSVQGVGVVVVCQHCIEICGVTPSLGSVGSIGCHPAECDVAGCQDCKVTVDDLVIDPDQGKEGV
jgi:hypothetical protein